MLKNIYVFSICLSLGTYLTRSLFLVFFQKHKLPDKIVNGLKYLPIGIFTALIVPAIFMPGGVVDFSIHNYHIIALVVLVVVLYFTKMGVLSIVAGMTVLMILNYFF